MSEARKVVLCSGEEVNIFEGDNKKEIQEISNWSKNGFIQPLKGKWIMPKDYTKIDELAYNFKFKPTDVFINGYPKSGTTWTQEVVWTILNNPDLNHPQQRVNVLNRVPVFEFDMFTHIDSEIVMAKASKITDIPIKSTCLEMYEGMPDERVFKTHLYPSVINQNMLDVSKMVYIVRNPLDSCYSYYLFHRYIAGFMGLNKEWSEYADIYIRGELFGGNAAGHIQSWWPYRNHKNFHMIFYEEMKKDPEGEIRKLAIFLEKELSEKQIQNVLHRTTFKTMKEIYTETEAELFEGLITPDDTKEQSSFFRKGTVGDSKDMPKGVYDKISAYCKESLKNLNLPYDFDPQ